MKLCEKHTQLRNREQVISRLVENVYATMQLEGQPVSEQTLRKLAERIVDEGVSEGFQFKQNQNL